MQLTNTQQTAIIIIIAIAVVVFILYKAGVFVPQRTGGVKGDKSRYRNIAKDAYNSLSGTNTDVGDVYSRVATTLLELTNPELITVSNEYNKMYHTEESSINTLRKLMNNEWLFSTTNRAYRSALNIRFDEIGI